jgi:hypothetical protein
MKRFFFILSFAFLSSIPLFAQEEGDDDEVNEKIQDKMSEYIQNRLNLTKDEAAKFTPTFVKYFKEWRQTIRENKRDKLIRQQKIVDLRLRYRPQFREILGERRGDQVFNQQDRFIKELMDVMRDRRMNRGPGSRPLRRNN